MIGKLILIQNVFGLTKSNLRSKQSLLNKITLEKISLKLYKQQSLSKFSNKPYQTTICVSTSTNKNEREVYSRKCIIASY